MTHDDALQIIKALNEIIKALNDIIFVLAVIGLIMGISVCANGLRKL
jgi:hypothetical protein